MSSSALLEELPSVSPSKSELSSDGRERGMRHHPLAMGEKSRASSDRDAYTYIHTYIHTCIHTYVHPGRQSFDSSSFA